MQLWFEDMIRQERDKRLAPELTTQMHICDAGCGVGICLQTQSGGNSEGPGL